MIRKFFNGETNTYFDFSERMQLVTVSHLDEIKRQAIRDAVIRINSEFYLRAGGYRINVLTRMSEQER